MAPSFHVQPPPELKPGLYQIVAIDRCGGEIICGHIVRIVPCQVITVDITSGVSGGWIRITPPVATQAQWHPESPVCLGSPSRIGVQWERVDQDRYTGGGGGDWSGSGYGSRSY